MPDQRKVALTDFDGVCSGDINVLESADPKSLLPELLPFICQTDRFFEHAVGTSAGSLSPRTNWESLAGYEFALPPLEEQLRAVTACIATDNAINAYCDVTYCIADLQARQAGCILGKSTVMLNDLAVMITILTGGIDRYMDPGKECAVVVGQKQK